MLEKKQIGGKLGLFYPKQTMKQAIKFLQKTFYSLESRTTISFVLLSYHLTKVAKCNSYMETFSSQSDTLHKWIKQIYEEDLKRAFELQVRKAIRSLNVRYAELAFDITKEPFYGKSRNLYTINCEQTKPYKAEFHYITCCLINKDKQIPLMALPVSYGEQIKLTIDLLRYCQTLFPKIRFALFDRGFYSAELIDYLEAKKIKYQIFIPAKRGILKELKQNTTYISFYNHTLLYSKAKTKWKPKTTIVTCKQIFGYDWLFATNIARDSPKDYVTLYKRRWQIETNYRVEDEAKIKSKSSNYMVRYFYFLISLLFHLFWIVNKAIKYYVQFKRFIDIVENKLSYKVGKRI